MIHSSKLSFGMLCLEQEKMALSEAVTALAAVLGCTEEFEGEPVVVFVFVGLFEQLLESI